MLENFNNPIGKANTDKKNYGADINLDAMDEESKDKIAEVKQSIGTRENKLVFIVDDNLSYANMLNVFLLNEIPGLETMLFNTGEACLHDMYLNPLAVVLDYYLDSKVEFAWNGGQILKKILAADPSANVIVISAQDKIEIALDCVKEGAREYVMKNEKAFLEIKKIVLNIIDDAFED
jgi:FixJ family two-component response regulator